MNAVGPEAAQLLRDIEMPIQNYEWKSDFAKKYVGEGRAEGLAQGRADSLLTVLAARGFAVDAALEQRVRAQTDLDVLDHWLRRAVVAGSLDEVFE